MSVPAERWEGAGNIYLLIDAEGLRAPLDMDQARTVCAILGGDGILEVRRNHGADVSMRIWNPDGTQSEACGNGTRMVARWLAEQTDQEHVSISTVALIVPRCRPSLSCVHRNASFHSRASRWLSIFGR